MIKKNELPTVSLAAAWCANDSDNCCSHNFGGSCDCDVVVGVGYIVNFLFAFPFVPVLVFFYRFWLLWLGCRRGDLLDCLWIFAHQVFVQFPMFMVLFVVIGFVICWRLYDSVIWRGWCLWWLRCIVWNEEDGVR